MKQDVRESTKTTVCKYIVDIGDDYFLVTFTSKQDQYQTMLGGLWLIYDNYLTLREWNPNFNPLDDHLEKVVVRVHFFQLANRVF